MGASVVPYAASPDPPTAEVTVRWLRAAPTSTRPRSPSQPTHTPSTMPTTRRNWPRACQARRPDEWRTRTKPRRPKHEGLARDGVKPERSDCAEDVMARSGSHLHSTEERCSAFSSR
jgi:hypothetical protein